MKGTSQRRAFMAQAYLVKSASMAAVSGLVLAGGQGRRMGGVDKGLQLLRGKPMVVWVIERFAPQADEIIVNANQNLDLYGAFGHRAVPHAIRGHVGPPSRLTRGLSRPPAEP